MHNVRKNDVKLFLSAVTDEFEPRDKTKALRIAVDCGRFVNVRM